MSSFYTIEELAQLGLGSYGNEVSISRFARFYNPQMIHLGNHVRIDDFCILSAGEPVRIGSHVHISAYAAIFGSAGVRLADFTALSTRVTIHTVSDDFSGESMTNSTVPEEYRTTRDAGPVTLERHAVVGAHSVVMPGVTLHEGAAVGALSLVTKDCHPWTIYFGAPAQRVRSRSRELLELENQLVAGEARPTPGVRS